MTVDGLVRRRWHRWRAGLAWAGALAALVCVAGTAVRTREGDAIAPLSAADYRDIETLYGRSLHELGTGSARAFAASFTGDGELVTPAGTRTGQAAIAEWSASMTGRRLRVTNLLIEATSAGARAFCYVLQSQGDTLQEAGLYRDALIRTGDGWRIRTRTYLPGTQWPPHDYHAVPSANQAPALSAVDYYEIKRLVQQYDVGWDIAGPWDKGSLESKIFTNDVLFVQPEGTTRSGPAAISAQAGLHAPGPHHWDTNMVISLQANGDAESVNYDMLVDVGDGGAPVTISGAGLLRHVYTKTPQGWRIRFRRYESAGTATWPAIYGTVFSRTLKNAPRDDGAALSAADQIEIEQLYCLSVAAFDNVVDQGHAFAEAFTPDGVLIQGGQRIVGQAKLAALAAAHAPGLRNWLSNLSLQPSRDGATARAYVTTIDMAREAGQKSKAVLRGLVTYEDVLVRTSDGWRFKTRTVTSEGSR